MASCRQLQVYVGLPCEGRFRAIKSKRTGVIFCIHSARDGMVEFTVSSINKQAGVQNSVIESSRIPVENFAARFPEFFLFEE